MVTYAVSERTKNSESVKQRDFAGAKIRFEASGRNLDKITYLELRHGGSAASKGAKEFSANSLLDGKQGIVDGDVKVADDYISLANLRIAGNLEIGKELENDFTAVGLKCKEIRLSTEATRIQWSSKART